MLALTSCTAQSPASTASSTVNGKAISVKYAAPSVKGRDIFGQGGLLSKERNYPIWRAGANTSTTLHSDGDLEIKGVAVPKGDYSMYVSLENPEQWQLILNKQTGQWGLSYNKDNDLARIPMDMGKPASMVETLRYTITPDGDNKAKLTLEWENRSASVPIVVK
jgi:hypothetical protein